MTKQSACKSPRKRFDSMRPALVRSQRRGGFTLAEAMITLSIFAISATAMLLAVESTVTLNAEVLDATVAHGLAQRTMQEVAAEPLLEIVHQGGQTPSSLNGVTGLPTQLSQWNLLAEFGSLTDSDGVELGKQDGRGGLRAASLRLPDGYFANWLLLARVSLAEDADGHYSWSSTSPTLLNLEISVWKKYGERWKQLSSITRSVADYSASSGASP